MMFCGNSEKGGKRVQSSVIVLGSFYFTLVRPSSDRFCGKFHRVVQPKAGPNIMIMQYNNTSSLKLVLSLIMIAAFSVAGSAQREWTEVRSKNFYLIGDASEKEIRKVATKLEQFRESFRIIFTKTNLNSSVPTNVVVFRNDSAYRPYKPKRGDGKIDNFVAGYFQPGEDVNYITLAVGGSDDDAYGIIFHEYVHFIMNTNFGKSNVPAWFNEGLAEYYQTFEIEKDQIVKLGRLQNGHLQLLNTTKMMPLETLFSMSNQSLAQNGNHSRSIFYAQSWALVHFLVQTGKVDGLGKFLSDYAKGIKPEVAIQNAFQLTYAEMEKQLRRYVSQRSFQYQALTLKEKLEFDKDMKVATLSEGQRRAFLGDLLYRIDRSDDAEEYLLASLTAEPDNVMANTSLGMLKLRQRKFDEAKQFLERAVRSGKDNYLAHYRLAYLISRSNQDEFGYARDMCREDSVRIRELLAKAIALRPDFTESYELLAFVSLVTNDQLDSAISHLRTALKYQPGNQRYAVRIAEILMRQDKFEEAKSIAEKLAATTDDPGVRSQAEGVLSSLRMREEITARNEAERKRFEERRNSVMSAGGGSAPVLLRRPDGTGPKVSPELEKFTSESLIFSINKFLRKPVGNEHRVLGSLGPIVCNDSTVTFAVESNGKKFSLSSKDFASLTLANYLTAEETINVGCGANLNGMDLVLTFDPSMASGTSAGNLIAIEFVPAGFRFMTEDERPVLPKGFTIAEDEGKNGNRPPPPPGPIGPANEVDAEARRREFMINSIRGQLKAPVAGEKRVLGFLEGTECNKRGMFFNFRTDSSILKLSASSAENLAIRVFSPDLGGLRFGCGMSALDYPVVIVYTDEPDRKNKTAGDIRSLDFVPKSFTLD